MIIAANREIGEITMAKQTLALTACRRFAACP